MENTDSSSKIKNKFLYDQAIPLLSIQKDIQKKRILKVRSGRTFVYPYSWHFFEESKSKISAHGQQINKL